MDTKHTPKVLSKDFEALCREHVRAVTAEAEMAGVTADRNRLRTTNAALLAALEQCQDALHAWQHQFAPEFCDEKYVAEYRSKVSAAGGTIAYLADIDVQIVAAITLAKEQS